MTGPKFRVGETIEGLWTNATILEVDDPPYAHTSYIIKWNSGATEHIRRYSAVFLEQNATLTRESRNNRLIKKWFGL